MKKVLTFCLVTICLCFFAILPFLNYKTSEKETPYSDEYIEYLNTEDKSIYGGTIPLMHEQASYEIETLSTFEDYYCLRDNYLLYTSDQVNFGLCWAHACCTSLETYIAINYDEYYNFSPAWVGLATKKFWDENNYPDYVVGSGGNINYFKYATENFGLMLNTNFDQTILYSVDNDNYNTFYELYKSKTLENFDFAFDYAYYTNPTQEQVKSHILANGSLYAGIYSKDIISETSLCSTTDHFSDHAVSIIGWDDKYKASSWTSPGAWIALNSWGDDWGDDGIFYISYNDTVANGAMYGIAQPKNREVYSSHNLKVSSSNSSLENYNVNKYTYRYNDKIGSFSQKNVFQAGQPMQLSYSISEEIAVEDIQVDVTKDEALMNSYMTSINLDKETKMLNLTANSLPSGTYLLDITIRNGENKTNIQKAFTVIDGLEIGATQYYSDETISNSNFTQATTHYTNFNTFNRLQTHFVIYADSIAYLRFYMPTYSLISSYEYIAQEGLNCSVSDSSFVKSENKTYSSGYLYFALKIKGEATSYNFSLTFKNLMGNSQSFYIHIIKAQLKDANYTYVNVDYNGALEDKNIPKNVVLRDSEKTYLTIPKKNTYRFDGWYTSSDLSEKSKLPSDEHGYYLTSDHMKKSTSKNYSIKTEKQEGIPLTFNYVNIFAKWTEVTFTITYNWKMPNSNENNTETITISSADTAKVTLKEALFAPGYTFRWISAYTKINYKNKEILDIDQNITIYGSFMLDRAELTSVKINDEILTENNTCINFTYEPSSSHKLSALASHSDNNASLSYTWYIKKGNFFESYSTSDTIKLHNVADSGEYKCIIKATNNNFESANIQTGTYKVTINRAKTILDVSQVQTDIYYNGQTQTITGAIVNHNEVKNSDIKYENNQVTDVGEGIRKVTITSPQTANYEGISKTIEVRLHKAKLRIKIQNKRGAVFSEPQALTYEIQEGIVYGNDELGIKFKTDANTFRAGSYTISATYNNSNYDIEIVDGMYYVYIEGLSLVLIIFSIVIFVALAVLLTYFIIKKRSNDRFLKASDFDEENF